ncbi:hypothetical protein F5Y05DRAFT_169692 [Hypoxylon sp. FL0543]|nr:hypothetical protein F5Y05DRAFT_169692 [Hypoxylon sp. FL0543]
MVVTELAFLTASLGGLSSEGKEATNQSLAIQDKWTAQNAPDLPKDRAGRGVALFRQVQDPSIYILSAHWDSAEQLEQWLKSPENQKAYPALGDYYDLNKTSVAHIENVWLFKSSGAPGEITLLDSPIVSVARISVPTENRPKFEKNWGDVKGLLENFAKPYAVRSGWRVEKVDPGLEEFVITAGWESIERHEAWSKDPNFKTYISALQPLAKSQDIQAYTRVL